MIAVKDVELLDKSVSIPSLNNKIKVESLYFGLVDEMNYLGWNIDVWDFEYMDYFTAGIEDSSNAKIINESLQEKFSQDLVNCINKLLS